jgi:hypothetical protein
MSEPRGNPVLAFLQLIHTALREIFDEAAYSRFLDRTQSSSTPQAYAAFCREQESVHRRRTRCC